MEPLGHHLLWKILRFSLSWARRIQSKPPILKIIWVVSNKNMRYIEGLYYEHSSSSVLQNSMRALFSNTHHSLLKYFICIIVLMLISSTVGVRSEYTGGTKICCQTMVCVPLSGWQGVCIKHTNYMANTKYYFFFSQMLPKYGLLLCVL